jgi:hypothetical protein
MHGAGGGCKQKTRRVPSEVVARAPLCHPDLLSGCRPGPVRAVRPLGTPSLPGGSGAWGALAASGKPLQ